MQDFAIMPQAQSPGIAGLRDARPYDVTLPHVPDAFRAVHQVMNLALQNRLEIRLHLPSCHLDPYAQRQSLPRLDAVDIRTNDADLSVIDLVEIRHRGKLERRGDVAAEFYMHVGLANALPLERRTVRDGDWDLRDLDLASPCPP